MDSVSLAVKGPEGDVLQVVPERDISIAPSAIPMSLNVTPPRQRIQPVRKARALDPVEFPQTQGHRTHRKERARRTEKD